jgi:UDP-3-O-[3-hydroxymyristoyl] N-acetylglucosamine deacetylase
VEFQGVGVHTGQPARLRVLPAPAGKGRVFRVQGREIPALAERVVRVERCTALAVGEAAVSTVEHVLAAAAGLGLDNLLLDLEGPEVPILDGSALPFVEGFHRAGIAELAVPASEPLELEAPLWVSLGEALVLALPWPHLVLEYHIHYPHPLVGFQSMVFDAAADDFAAQLAPARTYGFWEEVRHLLERGLARGGDFSNALVIRTDGYCSEPRFANEPARHKCLDLLGDLALLGRPLRARVVAVKAGHRLHVELVHRLLEVQASSVERLAR